MSSTPMDLDRPAGSANGHSLNIQRSMGSAPAVSNLSDIMTTFRPTKVCAFMRFLPFLLLPETEADIWQSHSCFGAKTSKRGDRLPMFCQSTMTMKGNFS